MKVIEWKPIKGFDGIYEVSNDGRVRSLDKKVNVSNQYGAKAKRIIKGRELKKIFNGMYYVVGLSNNNKVKQYFVHRLVAETFIENPNRYNCVNHIDCNKSNNNVENLEWCTQRHNIQHAYDTGLKKGVSAEHKGSNNPKSKLNEEQVLKILEFKKNKISIKEAFKILNYNISFSCFEQIWYGYNWKYLVEKVKE